MPRFRIAWKGTYDAPNRGERVLTMSAKNRKEAMRLHKGRFPCKTIQITVLRGNK